MTINQSINRSIDQSSNQSSSDPIDPCNQTGMMYNNQANNGVQMAQSILVLEHPTERPTPIEIELTGWTPDIPWDQVTPETRAIMEARVARGDGLIPLGLVKCESATNTCNGIVSKTELWYAYSGDYNHNYF